MLLTLWLVLGLGLPAPDLQGRLPALTRADLQSLLQGFVSRTHRKAFRHLGDERDFDHGHLLYLEDGGRPAAILYHTQELAHDHPASSPYGYLDPEARNWLQWVDTGRVENARAYLRPRYPRTAAWDWFRLTELPGLSQRRTILAKMLDPKRLGREVARSVQWEFPRADCPAAPRGSADPELLRIAVPGGATVCLKSNL